MVVGWLIQPSHADFYGIRQLKRTVCCSLTMDVGWDASENVPQPHTIPTGNSNKTETKWEYVIFTKRAPM